MKGANHFGLDRFTNEEIDNLLVGLGLGDFFDWRGDTFKVTGIDPFRCNPLWDLHEWEIKGD